MMNQHKIKKFTLFELLAVVSIFLIILSLLMPSLRKIINSSHNILCKDNLKTLYHGLSIYIEDNDNILPGPCRTYQLPYGQINNREPKVLASFLRDYLPEYKFVLDQANSSIYHYTDLLICPSAKEFDDQNNLNREYTGFYYQLTNKTSDGEFPFGRPLLTDQYGNTEEAIMPVNIETIPDLETRKFLEDVDKYNNLTPRIVNEFPAHEGTRNHIYLNGSVDNELWLPY